jgi:hypothetical protein
VIAPALAALASDPASTSGAHVVAYEERGEPRKRGNAEKIAEGRREGLPIDAPVFAPAPSLALAPARAFASPTLGLASADPLLSPSASSSALPRFRAPPLLAPVAAIPDEDREEIRFLPPIVHTLGLLTTLRITEAFLYPDPFAKGRYWRETCDEPPVFDTSRRPFEWDGDRWELNVIGHGLMGSELYVRPRLCGFGALGSLAWTAGASALWEYGFEGNAVRPSALDLVWTPVAGMALGEIRYRVVLAATKRDWVVLRAIFDPFGEIEHGITRAISGRAACGRSPG